MIDQFIHFFYDLNADGSVKRLNETDGLKHLKRDNLAWVHLDAGHDDAENWLRTHIDYLDPLIIDALLADNTRPRCEEIGDGMMIILRGINLNDNSDPEDMVSLRIWVDAHRIITLERRPLRAIRDLEDKIQQFPIVRNAGDFVAQISTRLFINMEPFVSVLSEHLDDVEEELTEHSNAQQRRNLTELRKKAIIYRRYFSPQRDVMNMLMSSDLPWLDQKHKRHFRENQDRMTRYLEDLDSVRERAQIIKDELTASLSEKLNRNLYILSIVTAIFLPLSFLTGLLGINVGGMPGAEDPEAFWKVAGLCLGLGVIQLGFLRFLRWV